MVDGLGAICSLLQVPLRRVVQNTCKIYYILPVKARPTSLKVIMDTYGEFGVKGTILGLRQFLATEYPLRMIKNPFYFTSTALFFLKIFKFLS